MSKRKSAKDGTDSPIDKRTRGSPAAGSGSASPALAFPASAAAAAAAAASATAMSDDSPAAPAAAAPRTTRGALALAHTPSPPPAAAATAAAGGASASSRAAAGNSPAPESKEDSKAADPNAIQPSPITMCTHDMGPHMRVKEDGLWIAGEKGYRMIRATHGINEGAIYYEMKYLPSTPLRISGKSTIPAVRLGVSTSDGDIQAPVGYDIESYALASMTGAKVHNAHVEEFAGEGFAFGDVIGVWLVLPADPNLSAAAAQAERAREEKEREEATKKKKGRGAKKATAAAPMKQSDKDDAAAAMLVDSAAAAAALPAVSDAELVQNRKFHRHSFLRFYKNGLPLGGASTASQIASGVVGAGVNAWSDKDVVRGTYFPAVSLYMGATVRLNFGPDFWCVPEEVTKGVALAMQQNQLSQAAQAEVAAAATAPATAASPSALPPAAPSTPNAAQSASPASIPAPSSFRHPLPRPLLSSGLFPHLDSSGSILQLNPKQLAHNVAVAEEARQRAVLAAYNAARAIVGNGPVVGLPLPSSDAMPNASTSSGARDRVPSKAS